MKYFLELAGGRPIEVEVLASSDSRYRIRCNGSTREATFDDIDRLGQYLLQLDSRCFAVSIEERRATDLQVAIAGKSFRVQALDERERAAYRVAAASGPRAETVVASMPGIVVEVRVEPGQEVPAGTAVAVLEAMKMQNEVATRHGGVVAEVLVEAGQTVTARQPLLRLVPAPESA